MRTILEQEFRERITAELADPIYQDVGAVTGPGRSGAIAAVYASHILRIPFIPFKQKHPSNLGRLLLIDTAIQTGKTLRKAERWYAGVTPLCVALYNEPPRVCFWYEPDKPQFYKHELAA